ncbi:MAG: glutamate--tRNA ligase [Candidatus Levybacteria bacterium]|nr:glutamate--tRNA ligase [Candidatus Levybacteria bacterium]
MNKQIFVRTRIAPSPTGEDIHIGNIYTALINFAFAKKQNGKFIVRIEDTDRERLVEGSEQKILDTLKAYGLIYDEGPDKDGDFGPYRQSDRLDIYKKHAEELIRKGAAYYCFCSKERLESIRLEQQKNKQIPRYDKYCLGSVKNAQERIETGEKYVIRLNVLPNKKICFTDVVRGEISFDSNLVDDQVLLKSDGYPTYHLGVVVDDHLMQISHVIRAEDWISSTPKHVILYESFGWPLPVFVHVPLLRNPDKSKLSKRKNPVWAGWYLEQGYLPEAILNFLALLGWSHPEEKERFDLQEFINLFDLKDLKAVGPIFDVTKLTWMNQQYIQNLDNTVFKVKLTDFYRESDIIYNFLSNESNNQNIDTILNLAKTRMERLSDFFPLIKYLLIPPSKDKLNDEHFKVIPETLSALAKVSAWKKDEIFNALKSIMSERKSVRMPLFYILFTGNKYGLPLPDMLEILGKETTISRLRLLQ